jgi:hypothetical protein
MQQVVDHLKTAFKTAGLAPLSNSDGVGYSMRAASPECDLLIRLREAQDGTSVRISCAAPTAAQVLPTPAIVNANPSSVRTASRRTQSGDAHTRQVLADAEAAHQRRIADMGRYDKPVSASEITRSFYNDDAPPLQWPAWLVQEGSDLPPAPKQTRAGGKIYLEAKYRTTLRMSHLYQFYEALFKANGFSIGTARLSTGHTITGNIVQNTSGHVEASLSQDGTVNGPRTHVNASFHRSYLNEPITVTLRVEARGSFGRR